MIRHQGCATCVSLSFFRVVPFALPTLSLSLSLFRFSFSFLFLFLFFLSSCCVLFHVLLTLFQPSLTFASLLVQLLQTSKTLLAQLNTETFHSLLHANKEIAWIYHEVRNIHHFTNREIGSEILFFSRMSEMRRYSIAFMSCGKSKRVKLLVMT